MTRSLVAEPGRLDAVVAKLTGAPRADVQRAIAGGAVLVDGASRPKSFRLAGGERLTVELLADEPLAPEGPPVSVRFEDEHIAIVAKPAGVVTHPAAGRRRPSPRHRPPAGRGHLGTDRRGQDGPCVRGPA